MRRAFLLISIFIICLFFSCCSRNGNKSIPDKGNVPSSVDASAFESGEYGGASVSKTDDNGVTSLVFTRKNSEGSETFSALYRGNGSTLTAVEYKVSDFDENGRLRARREYGLIDGTLALLSQSVFEYDGSKVTETKRNSSDAVTETSVTLYNKNGQAVSGTVCDSRGLLLSETAYGEKQTETVYKYSYGVLSERIVTETDGTTKVMTSYSPDNAKLYTIECVYDDEGRLKTETKTNGETDKPEYVQVYSYSGIFTQSKRTAPDGTLLLKMKETSENGALLLRETVLYSEGKTSGSIKEELNSDYRPSKTYAYNENGTLEKYTLFGYSCGKKTKESVYSYADGALALLTEREYSDITGECRSVSEYERGEDIVSRRVFALTEKGLSVTEYSYEKELIEEYTVRVYDKKNNELSKTLYNASGDPVSKKTHSYRADGSLLSEGSFTYTQAIISEGSETTFNPDGTSASETTFGENGKTIGKLSFIYTNGVKTGMSATGKDSEFLYRETYDYNESGLVSLIHRYSGNDKLILIIGYDYMNGVIFNESAYEYDGSGSLISHSETTYSDGKINSLHKFDASEVSVFSALYTYTSDGKILVKEYSYTDGVITKDTDKVLDTNGNLLEYTERTGWGELVTSETYTVESTEPVSETETQTDTAIIKTTTESDMPSQ